MDVQSPQLSFQGAAHGNHGQRNNSVGDLRPQSSQQQQGFGRQRGAEAMPMGPANGSGFGGSMHRRGGTAQGSNGAVFTREASTGTKNTAHVPCKFFMAGNCQAGKACPFSHVPESFNHPTPCKYFAKGNCKYGYKCANPHLLPDGSDARRAAPARQHFSRDHFSLGPPAQPGYSEPMTQGPWSPAQPSSPSLASSQEPYSKGNHGRNFDNLSANDIYNNGQMHYGSPTDPNRHLPISPAVRALDATIPPTFDSNGTSNLAFEREFPASLPPGFGFGHALATTSMAMSTAFANLDSMTKRDMNGSSNRLSTLSSSPPAESDNRRNGGQLLHSERVQQMYTVASSLPMPPSNMRPAPARFGDESSDDEGLNLLPDALSDIMTADEKRRRYSRNDEDNGGGERQSLSRFGSPPGSAFGSPSNASPSVFGALFARKQREDNHNDTNNVLGSSPYGSIGEHLRNTSLSTAISPSLRPIAPPESSRIAGDISPFGMSSPPDRQRGGALSMLSQQFNSIRLRDNGEREPQQGQQQGPQQAAQQQTNGTRSISSGSSALSANPGRPMRDVSSSSVGRSDRIEEEPSIFEMDEQEDDMRKKEAERQQRRVSGQVRLSPWNDSPAETPNESGRSSPGLGLRGLGETRGETRGEARGSTGRGDGRR